MTAVLYTPHYAYFTDDNGDPLAGGKLYTYEAGTSTPKATYTTAAGDVEQTNPVVLDAYGRATLFLDGAYKFVLKDSEDNVITNGTTDNVTAFSTELDVTNAVEVDVASDDKVLLLDASNGEALSYDTVLNVAASSVGLALLGSYTASNATSVDIGDGLDLDAAIDDTYEEYEIHFNGITPAASSVLWINFSTDGGSSFDTGAYYNYTVVTSVSSSDTIIGSTRSTGSTKIQTVSNGASTSKYMQGIIKIFTPSEAANTFMLWDITYSNGSYLQHCRGAGEYNVSSAIDALRLFMSTGNITSGNFYLYGVKKS